MAGRACDQHPPFSLQPQPRRPAPKPAPVEEQRTVETVSLVFGPSGRFAGFERTYSTEPKKRNSND